MNAFSVSINLIFIDAFLKLNCNEENAHLFINENSFSSNYFLEMKGNTPKLLLFLSILGEKIMD